MRRGLLIGAFLMAEPSKPETATEVAAASVQEVKAAAEEQYDSVLRAIRRSPLQAVAIAAGVGFVLALIVR
jgi:ElaB/YqjD/DUF883 family membrane-anchored ribosome-binding protein